MRGLVFVAMLAVAWSGEVRAQDAAAGEKAGLGHVHPHMLRHSCGYALADKGTDLRTMQDYLGHRDPAMTVRYTRVAARRFEGLF